MASQRTNVAHYLTGPMYAVGFLFVFSPLADTFAQVWPPSFGNPSWRYGTIGVGANYVISVLFGMLLMSFVAGRQAHRRTLLVLTWVNVVFALVAIAGTVTFVLDALQVRAGLPRNNEATLRMFTIGTEKATLKYLLGEIVLLWLALVSWRAARAIPRDAEAPKLVGKQAH